MVAATCAVLGVWQIRRYGESAARSREILAAWELEPISAIPAAPDPALRHRRARISGTWAVEEPARVSGGVVGGQPGHQVVSRLHQVSGPDVLVDRGWVPFDLSRDRLLALRETGTVTLEGLVVAAEGRTDLRPIRGADGSALWPLETDRAYGLFPRALGPPFGAMVAAAEPPVAPWVLRVGPAFEPEHSRPLRGLPVPGYVLPLPRTHHLSYAAQWFAFAALALALWAWASIRSGGPRT